VNDVDNSRFPAKLGRAGMRIAGSNQIARSFIRGPTKKLPVSVEHEQYKQPKYCGRPSKDPRGRYCLAPQLASFRKSGKSLNFSYFEKRSTLNHLSVI
jgi:hypothetical protein